PRAARVGERPVGRLADEAGDRHVLASRHVLGLPCSQDCCALSHFPASITHTRFCCRHGPLVAWATARWPSPADSRRAASPIQAGRSHRSRARSPAASTITAAPSVIGGRSCLRRGSAYIGSSSRAASSYSPESCACGLPIAARRLRATTRARSFSETLPLSSS